MQNTQKQLNLIVSSYIIDRSDQEAIFVFCSARVASTHRPVQPFAPIKCVAQRRSGVCIHRSKTWDQITGVSHVLGLRKLISVHRGHCSQLVHTKNKSLKGDAGFTCAQG